MSHNYVYGGVINQPKTEGHHPVETAIKAIGPSRRFSRVIGGHPKDASKPSWIIHLNRLVHYKESMFGVPPLMEIRKNILTNESTNQSCPVTSSASCTEQAGSATRRSSLAPHIGATA